MLENEMCLYKSVTFNGYFEHFTKFWYIFLCCLFFVSVFFFRRMFCCDFVYCCRCYYCSNVDMIHDHWKHIIYAGRDKRTADLKTYTINERRNSLRISDRMEIMILFIVCRFLTLFPNKTKVKYKSKHPFPVSLTIISHKKNLMEWKHPLHVNDDMLIWRL